MLGICPAVDATSRYVKSLGAATYRVSRSKTAPGCRKAKKTLVARLRKHEVKNMINDNLSGRVWENGEFSVGVLTKLLKVDPYADLRSAAEIEEGNWRLNLAKVHGYEQAVEFLASLEDPIVQEVNEAIPLGLSNASNSHSRKKRGSTGISTYGRHVVKNAAYRLQLECGRKHLSFLTLTLPNVSKAEAARVSANWSEVIRVFVQWLGRQLKKAGLPGEIVGVTEIQEKRLASTGVFALHFHCVFKGRHPYQGWVLQPEDVREQWKKCLEKYLNFDSYLLEWDACENIQRVKKDAAGYLGKYMSKGAKDLARPEVQCHQDIFPTSWWSCTTTLRDKVNEHIRSVSGERGKFLLDMCTCHEIVDCFRYVKPVVLSFEDGSQICIGWYGQLNSEGMKMLFS